MSIADTEPAMRMVTIEFSKSNGEQSKFHVLQEQAFLCGLFRSMLEADISDEKEEAQAIPLCESDMSLETFQIVVEFLELYQRLGPLSDIPKPLPDNILENFVEPEEYISFIESTDAGGTMTPKQLCALVNAAVFLQCEPLETLACAKIASLLIHKTPEQIRQTFDIVNDYTPEEEEAIRRENDSWLC